MSSIIASAQLTVLQKVLFTTFAVTFSAVLSVIVFSSGVTHAAVGTGGSGTGGGGGHQAVHGYGWYSYDVNGGGPNDGFRDGTSWGSVQAMCKGSLRVIAFVVLDAAGDHMVYKWPGWNNPAYYKSGGDWLSIPAAKSYYDTVPANEKLNFTWGDNVAWFCYGDATKEWSVSGGSRIQKGTPNESAAVYGTITAAPGEQLNWYHHLRNDGPEDMDKQIFFNIGKSGFPEGSPSWNAIDDPQGWVSGGVGVLLVRHYATSAATYTLYGVTQNDVGNTLCQRIRWSDLAWNNGNDGAATPACASIPYNYALNPTVNLNPTGIIEAGASYTVTPNVLNPGGQGKTKSKPTQWQLTYIEVDSGATAPSSMPSNSDPCTEYRLSGRCTSIASGSNVTIDSGKSFNAGGVRTVTAPDVLVGTQLCYVLSVKDMSDNDSRWRHVVDCVTVSKRPLVQILGSDLLVGRGAASSSIVTGVKPIAGMRYGSWGEYGVAASGSITGIGSARGYKGGTTLNQCNVSTLTFSNRSANGSCSESSLGNYVFNAASNSIANRFPASTANQAPVSGSTVANFASGNTYTTTAGAYTLAGGTVGAGVWFVINAPNTTVTIANNLTYANGPFASVSKLPQVVIIARNIVIAESVTQVDAWLVATGTGSDGRLSTCDNVTSFSDLTSKRCTFPLQVNGPVIARHLYLRRTAGAGTGSAVGNPAETFNLRPDAYLWAAAMQQGTPKVQTVITKELPPRY